MHVIGPIAVLLLLRYVWHDYSRKAARAARLRNRNVAASMERADNERW